MLKDKDTKDCHTAYDWADAIYMSREGGGTAYENMAVKKALCKKIRGYFRANAAEFNKLSKDLVTLRPLSLQYKSSIMECVYKRPEITSCTGISSDGINEYEIDDDRNIGDGRIFNSNFTRKKRKESCSNLPQILYY